MGVQMGENIPLKSKDLERIFNSNIGDYGYKKITQHKTSDVEEASDRLEETYRTDLRRQRDKILYTGGFRRLQDKTQVISATREGDHRTRLTHTLEVEQIAISIANALKLNVDLVSAIALGHDVGHTPFGHAAERKLCKLLEHNGQFHHPIQSIRYLWEKYGSKLDAAIYEGILLHDSDMYKIKKKAVKEQFNYLKNIENESEAFEDWVNFDRWLNTFPSTLESQVVIWADKIAYITHDLEDFLRCPAYTNLKKNNKKIENELCKILGKLIGKKLETLDDYESRDLIRSIITNLIESSANTIKSFDILTQDSVKLKTDEKSKQFSQKSKNKKYLDSLLINFDNNYRDYYYELRYFLDRYYILSPEVQKSDAKAEVIVEWLFTKMCSNYRLLPLSLREEVDYWILKELIQNKDLKPIYDKLPKKDKTLMGFEDKIDKLSGDEKIEVENTYKDIRTKIVSRKVACYIATMSDTYAENMYRDLIGSSVDFNL